MKNGCYAQYTSKVNAILSPSSFLFTVSYSKTPKRQNNRNASEPAILRQDKISCGLNYSFFHYELVLRRISYQVKYWSTAKKSTSSAYYESFNVGCLKVGQFSYHPRHTGSSSVRKFFSCRCARIH